MPMTSNAAAKMCGARAYGGLMFVPDIDLRSLIAAFSEFTPSTLSLRAEPIIAPGSWAIFRIGVATSLPKNR